MAEAEVKTRVLIIDDHRMFADSLARLLADEDDLEVVAIGCTAEEGVQLAHDLHPRVVLVDYQLSTTNGVAVAAEILRDAPDMKIVMLTGTADDRVLLAAIEVGCIGFLNKSRAAPEVLNAVRLASAGEALISPTELARLLPNLSRTHRSVGDDLTAREREILTLLAEGRSNALIADELFLSVNTVRNYVQSVLTKLGAHSKLEAVATGVREGVIAYPTEQRLASTGRGSHSPN
jgi:DNA-binding NarL/FixJ family response regulator